MLKGLPGEVTPELLHALAAMGHGDAVVIVDANFPAHSTAAATVWGRALDIGTDAPGAVAAILRLLPIDRFDPERPPVTSMGVVGDPDATPEVVAEAAPLFAAEGYEVALIERFAFYEAARAAFVLVRCLEPRPYGNFLIRKGVLGF